MSKTYYSGSGKKRVSSRLVKKQQTQVWKQVWLFAIAAVILILVFIFVLLPVILNVLFPDSDNPSLFNQDTIPPQVPTLAAPPQATFSAQLTLTGYGESGSTVVLVVNDDEYERKPIDEEGSFAFELNLKEGSNSVTAFSIDEADNESATSRLYNIELDREPPPINLTTPEDGQSFELRKNQTISIEGETEPNSQVFINGRMILVPSSGTFSTQYTLQEGENILAIKITDKAGNSSEREIKVLFSLD